MEEGGHGVGLSMEKPRAYQEGATASVGTEKVVAMCLGYLACRKKLEMADWGSVKGLEFVRFGNWSSTREGSTRWKQRDMLVTQDGLGRRNRLGGCQVIQKGSDKELT